MRDKWSDVAMPVRCRMAPYLAEQFGKIADVCGLPFDHFLEVIVADACYRWWDEHGLNSDNMLLLQQLQYAIIWCNEYGYRDDYPTVLPEWLSCHRAEFDPPEDLFSDLCWRRDITPYPSTIYRQYDFGFNTDGVWMEYICDGFANHAPHEMDDYWFPWEDLQSRFRKEGPK